MPGSPPRIFLSYRREETGHLAGRLGDRLVARFGPGQVFTDVDSIGPGVDFAQAIEREVGACDVLLALIGRTWTTITNERGYRRIDDPDDWVALEICTALQRNIKVVPVLVDGAAMPRQDELPIDLKKLSLRQAARIDYETFRSDVEVLLLELGKDSPVLKSRLTSERPVLPLRKLSIAVTILLGLSAALTMVLGIVNLAWPASESPTEYTLADISRERFGIAVAFIIPCTIILFLVYLYLARVNAEALAPSAKQRHAPIMVVFAWLIPVVQFWWPKQILDDVWRASRPDTPRDITDLSALPKPGLVRAWWFGFATFWGVLWVWFAMSLLWPYWKLLPGVAKSEHSLTPFSDAVFFIDIFLIYSLAAIPAILLVHRITSMQEARLKIIERMQR